ncbi:helicase-related protein [Liquorilactobacillus capillatus]|uniref:Dead deah box helicase n=1 Tax=Liquorilactobacillus capillatus DSM 19910 TaxID=1423731 RepID=A0A0R1M4B2_9LACO|nr:helicase-related protein [Liquorilactobacillus capillatus]KRL02895.1 dead deah box helicase [Liquorilactobacillus capillatus DSM 19910]
MKIKIKAWSKTRRPFLIFVSKIALLTTTYDAVQKVLPAEVKGTTVHAEDPQRIEKVSALREGKIIFLITTTILERGVTFPGLNVLVLGAEDSIFTSSVLVQIAGRVGRSIHYPTGDILFLCQMVTRTIKGAIKQIMFLNRKGRKLLG